MFRLNFKPLRTRSPSASHRDEMARRKTERNLRTTGTYWGLVDRHTRYPGWKLRAIRATSTNHHGEPRR